LAGDGPALRFCVGLLLPPRRDNPVTFDLPDIAGPGDLVKAARSLLPACAEGALSPIEALEVADVIAAVLALERLAEAERRVNELERRLRARAETIPDEPPPCRTPVFNSHRTVEDGRQMTDGREHQSSRRQSPVACNPAPRPGVCKSPVFNLDRTTEDGRQMTDGPEHQSSVLRRLSPAPRPPGGPSVNVLHYISDRTAEEGRPTTDRRRSARAPPAADHGRAEPDAGIVEHPHTPDHGRAGTLTLAIQRRPHEFPIESAAHAMLGKMSRKVQDAGGPIQVFVRAQDFQHPQ
jgi:hypothetical protein